MNSKRIVSTLTAIATVFMTTAGAFMPAAPALANHAASYTYLRSISADASGFYSPTIVVDASNNVIIAGESADVQKFQNDGTPICTGNALGVVTGITADNTGQIWAAMTNHHLQLHDGSTCSASTNIIVGVADAGAPDKVTFGGAFLHYLRSDGVVHRLSPSPLVDLFNFPVDADAIDIAADANDNVYTLVANGNVKKYDLNGIQQFSWNTGFASPPTGIAVNGTHIQVTSQADNLMKEFNFNGSLLYATIVSATGAPADVDSDSSGQLFEASHDAGINVYGPVVATPTPTPDVCTGAPLPSWTLPAGVTYETGSMTEGPDGSLYVMGDTKMVKYDSNGNVLWQMPSVVPSPYVSFGVTGASSAVVGTNLYVQSMFGHPTNNGDGVFVQTYSTVNGTNLEADPFPGNHTHPQGAAYDLDADPATGHLWLIAGPNSAELDPVNHTVVRPINDIPSFGNGTVTGDGHYWTATRGFSSSNVKRYDTATYTEQLDLTVDGRVNGIDSSKTDGTVFVARRDGNASTSRIEKRDGNFNLLTSFGDIYPNAYEEIEVGQNVVYAYSPQSPTTIFRFGCGTPTPTPTPSPSPSPTPLGEYKDVLTFVLQTVGNGPATFDAIQNKELRVYNTDDAAFKAAYGTSFGSSWKTKLNLIYEGTTGRISSCTTDGDGACTAYKAAAGNYLVVGRYDDSATGKSAYVSKQEAIADFSNPEKTAYADLKLQKHFKKGAFEKYGPPGQVVETPIVVASSGGSGLAAAIALVLVAALGVGLYARGRNRR